jgi:hypothetical protein
MFVVIIAGFIFCTPISGLAHFLKVDGSIGITLHINPDDDPIVGQDAVFFLDTKDTNNKFSMPDCDCSAKITKGSDLLFQTQLVADQTNPTSNTPTFTYVFPSKGVYTLEVDGSSYSNNFQTFKISWDIRVQREAAATTDSSVHSHSNIAEYLIFGAGFLFILAVAAYQQYKNWKSKKKGKSPPPSITSLIVALLLGGLVLINFGFAHGYFGSHANHIHSPQTGLEHSQNYCSACTNTVPLALSTGIFYLPGKLPPVPSLNLKLKNALFQLNTLAQSVRLNRIFQVKSDRGPPIFSIATN